MKWLPGKGGLGQTYYTVPSLLHQELSQRTVVVPPGSAACVGGGVTAGVEVSVIVNGAVSEGATSSSILKGPSPLDTRAFSGGMFSLPVAMYRSRGSFSLPVTMASIADMAVPSWDATT